MSIKTALMVADIKDNNKHYILMTESMIRSYLIKKYKCSVYMANKVIKELFKEE